MPLYKKNSIISQYFIAVLAVLALSACGENTNKAKIDCQLDTDQCLTVATKSTKIMFNTPEVIVENQYQVSIDSHAAIDRIYLQGLNMNMGQIPLVIELTQHSNDNWQYQAQLYLGMCSEPQMQWAMTVEFESGQIETAVFNAYWQMPD